jgi:excisionase family DNA binding protein
LLDAPSRACTYTTAEVAALLGVTDRTVATMCNRGVLPFIWAGKEGSKRLFPIARFWREVMGTEPPTSDERSES